MDVADCAWHGGIAFSRHMRGKQQISLALKTYFDKLVIKVPKGCSQKVVLLQKELRRHRTQRSAVTFRATAPGRGNTA
jgi:hypothetical protein